MKTLLLVENNLGRDTRMKRHVTALLELGHEVTVLASPYPDATPGMTADGLDIQMWRCPEITLHSASMRRLAREAGVIDYVFKAFPAALIAPRSYDLLEPLSRIAQRGQMASPRWDGFRAPVCKPDLPPQEDCKSLACFFEFMLHWAAEALRHPADLVYCVDLPTLLAGLAHKRKYGSTLVYDAHEVYYDMAPGMYTLLWKQGLALLELHLADAADWVIGVSESHASWMRRTYGLNPEKVLCVPNCFAMGEDVPPPPRRVPHTPLRIYYHGSSDPYRGLGAIARAVAAEPTTQLILRCPPSEAIDEVRQVAQSLQVQDRIKILPLVPPDQMIDAIRAEADVGIHVTVDMPLAVNLKVALTNKFIEYLLAGIPIITAPLEEQERIVREHDVGCVLADNSVDAIRAGLREMVRRRDELPTLQARAYAAGVKRFSWKSIRAVLTRALRGPVSARRVISHGGMEEAA